MVINLRLGWGKTLLILILGLSLLIRIWDISGVPASLFGDEVDMAYHSYSLLHTGRDYMGNLLPIHLESLADQKSSLYAYSSIPSIAAFGITPLGIRLPAVIFSILSILLLYLVVKELFKNRILGLLSSFLLALTPWHIHLGRWGSEANEMLALFLLGTYFFLKSFKTHNLLILASLSFGLSLWSYHSAKLVVPAIILMLILIFKDELLKLPRRVLLVSLVIFTVVVAPLFIDTVLGQGASRFNNTSIFSSPTYGPEIGFERLRDAKMRDKGAMIGVEPELLDKLIHNKFTYFFDATLANYFSAYSPEFLFIKGDPNIRHSLPNFGLLYKFQAIFLVLGLIFLFKNFTLSKTRNLLIFWILISPIASVITIGGGNHATRLFVLVPALVILIALGIYYSYQATKFKKVFLVILGFVTLSSFIFYQHQYWIHYPWDSQRGWQYGIKEAVLEAQKESKNYDQVIISSADEPMLIFFLGFSEFPPYEFQKSIPLQKENILGFGRVGKLGKYYFPEIGVGIDLYQLGSILPAKTLYLATFKEIKQDLINEPERLPKDLKLIKSISFPSGEPAYYLFTKN